MMDLKHVGQVPSEPTSHKFSLPPLTRLAAATGIHTIFFVATSAISDKPTRQDADHRCSPVAKATSGHSLRCQCV
jgi:hypothetical protein